MIVGVWILCVSIQRFAVPYIFEHVLQPYQVERILNTFGVDYVPGDIADAQKLDEQKEKELANTKKLKKAKENYNVKQSKIAIGSGGFMGKGFLKGTQTQEISYLNNTQILYLPPSEKTLVFGEAAW